MPEVQLYFRGGTCTAPVYKDDDKRFSCFVGITEKVECLKFIWEK